MEHLSSGAQPSSTLRRTSRAVVEDVHAVRQAQAYFGMPGRGGEDELAAGVLRLPEKENVPHLDGWDGADVDAVQGRAGRVYDGVALCGLRVSSTLRRACIRLVEWRYFDPIILVTILLNCTSAAWESPLDPPGTAKARVLSYLEAVYLTTFTVEMSVKVVAYGLLLSGPRAYLRDPWCCLDGVIVLVAWLPIFAPAFGQYTALRAFRALRPLRAASRVPGMSVLIASILAAVPKLGNVLLLCAFLFSVLGVVGMECARVCRPRGSLLHRFLRATRCAHSPHASCDSLRACAPPHDLSLSLSHVFFLSPPRAL